MQAEVVKILQHCADMLEQPDEELLLVPPSVYLWGKVGRGKSFLMDAFYQCCNITDKRRVHFYRFMQEIHLSLAQHQGQVDPLIDIANKIADKNQLLCFDEFFVSDIADAMLLSGLIRQLFKRGVAIIATSNVEPTRLYENGLQRPRFLPAIAAIEANMKVIELAGQVDHRLRYLAQSNAYFIPQQNSSNQDDEMQQHFIQHCENNYQKAVEVNIEHRQIRCEYLAGDTIWFEFEQLCMGPRSQNDYIALANRYRRVYIANVPQMGGSLTDRNIAQGTEDAAIGHQLAQLNNDRQKILVSQSKSDDEARRFITLVDEFYDHKVALYLSSTVPIVELYLGGRVKFEFERTVSRLIEMQSVAYLNGGLRFARVI